MQFPLMFRLRQSFDSPRLTDISSVVRSEMSAIELVRRVQPRDTVAITAGSRGVANIVEILKTVVACVQELGAEPFIVPAMGSHGGATAEGQRGVLARYGITPESMGCPIRSSMETVVIGSTPRGLPIHFDKHAYEADHVFVVNRVKPHTRFTGDIESGLHKMLLIGLGKREGAQLYHRAIHDQAFSSILHDVTGQIFTQCSIVGGLGIIENSDDETGLIAGVRPEEFGKRERELLAVARQWLPGLPFADCDVLIIDEIGKDISGSGFDTNVAGRKYDDKRSTDGDRTQVQRIFVRGLTEGTHGNATGIGLADFTNDRTVRQIDRPATNVNCVTGGHPTAAAIPISYATDQECITAALMTLGLTSPEESKILRIRNTLDVAEVWASAAYWKECGANPRLTALCEAGPMRFDEDGNLLDSDVVE